MPHVLVNALSVGSSGNLTVVRELTRYLRAERPEWPITLLITDGRPLHDQLVADLSDWSIEVERAPATTRKIPARMWWERRHLAGVIKRLCVDVVFTPTGTVVGNLGVPVLAHFGDPWPYLPVRDLWYDPIYAYLRRRGHAAGLRRASAAGFTSGFLRDILRDRFGKLPEPNAVLYNGVPDAWVDRDRATLTPLDRRPHEIVTVSQVSKYKRQELVIRALPAVIERTGLRDLRYRILGGITDALRQQLSELAADLGVATNVSIEGHVDDATVRQAFAQSRAFVSMSICESFGIPAVEAMSFGTPVVVARATAVPEICGDAAAFVTADSVSELAGTLARVLVDPIYAATLREAGFENVKRFRWSSTAKTLAMMLERLADTYRTSGRAG